MDSNAEEQAHYEGLRADKTRRLRTIERQIERQGGDAWAETHLLVERAELRAYLGVVEPVVVSPIPSSIGDDLGPNGRFLATMELARQTSNRLADLVSEVQGQRGEQIDLKHQFAVFIAETVMWRKQKDEEDEQQRTNLGRVNTWLVIGGVVLVGIVVAVAVLITLYIDRGA